MASRIQRLPAPRHPPHPQDETAKGLRITRGSEAAAQGAEAAVASAAARDSSVAAPTPTAGALGMCHICT